MLYNTLGMGEESMPSGRRFTVFTATYNRAHCLHRVADSLAAQTFNDFEWLIVDDGSTDHTRELVETYQRTFDFPVRYRWQRNLGQHYACNRGLGLARGELFCMVDSDDAIVPEALALLDATWRNLPARERGRFFGVGGLCVDERGVLVGDSLPTDVFDTDPLEMTFRWRIKGQKWWCVRTDLLRLHRWQEAPYKSPNPWYDLSRHYRVRLIDRPLKIFYQDDPEQSLSRARGKLHPEMVRHRNLEILNDYLQFVGFDPLGYLQVAIHLGRCQWHLGVDLKHQWRAVRTPLGRVVWLAAMPLSMLVYLRDRQRRVQIRTSGG